MTHILPFVDFHFSTVRRGFYSPSIVGMMKDGSRAYERILNVSLPQFSKAVNPIVLLFGTKEERTIEEMQIAQEMQEMGVSKMIPVGENVAMQSIKPESVFQDFEIARNVIFRDLAMRYDVNFQALEEQEQTATEFIGKTKAELKSIQGLYTINAGSFALLAEYSVAMGAEFWTKSDDRITEISIGALAEETELQITLGETLGELKDWDGSFVTETDLKMPVSTQDKRQSINEMEAAIANVFYGRPFTSVKEIELEIDSLVQRAILNDLDDTYTRKKFITKAQRMIESREAQQQQMMPQEQEIKGEQVNEDVSRELSPNAFLSEAGLN